MSNGLHFAGSRPWVQGGVTAWKGRKTFIPATLVLLTPSRKKPVLRNILVNSNAICSCAAEYLIDWKFRIQRNGALCWLWAVFRASFSLHMNQRKTIFRSWQLASGLVPRSGPSSGMPQPRWGPHSPREELLPGQHMWAPPCRTGAGTPGSTPCPPCTGPRSAFRLPSPDHHVPAPAHHISNENGQDSQTTTQTQVVMQGKMTLPPQ